MEIFLPFDTIPARLLLKTGEVFEGYAPTWCSQMVFGEVVFNTGMVGYVESLTDPSYAGQILTFTAPLIGNYGIPAQDQWESYKIHLRGIIAQELSPWCDHYEAKETLVQWLQAQEVPFLCGVDTRQLTKTLRIRGVTPGVITCQETRPDYFPDPNATHLVASVSHKEIREYGTGQKKVIVVNCGMKRNILRCLQNFPLTLKVVPYDYDYSHEEFDGVFISNGPGDPILCDETVTVLRKILTRKKPVFGICLGAQLLALSIGAKTYKLPFGHRGQNQPCEWVETKQCFLTSQNHSYAIEESSLPVDWKVNFRNLNDGSVEGITHSFLPFFAVQFHPEAHPGPIDTMFLFEKFYQLL